MPVTLSYDLRDVSDNDRTYVRSMLERFHWRRLGGSVFRYDGVLNDADGTLYEDWLNHIVPSLMFFRAFLLSRNITLRFFTIDVSSTSFVDWSDPTLLYGNAPNPSTNISFNQPTNEQSSINLIRQFIDQTTVTLRPLDAGQG